MSYVYEVNSIEYFVMVECTEAKLEGNKKNEM